MPDHDSNEHSHEALSHEHEHYHVTHNFNPATGGFEHMSSRHSHSHGHDATTHAHLPHQDFDREHVGEDHVHDHPTPGRASGSKSAAKKASGPLKAKATKATKAARVAKTNGQG